MVRQDPAEVGFKSDLALTYHNLSFLAKTGQERRALLEQALELRKQLAEALPGNLVFRRHLARTYYALGRDQHEGGQPQDARALFQESRALLHQVLIKEPNSTTCQENLANSCELLGYTLTKLGQHREAHEAFMEARTMYQKLVQSNSENSRYKDLLREVETMVAESEKASKTHSP